MSSEAVFMGGPADGRLQVFPGDEPPGTVIMHVAPRIPWHQWDADLGGFVTNDPQEAMQRPYRVEEYVYLRRVSQLDDGPYWVFVPRDTPSHLP